MGGGNKEIIYADLQLPRASNNGSMRPSLNRGSPTEYAEISFQPPKHTFSRASLRDRVDL